MNLVGMTKSFHDGVMSFAPDLKANLALGDANYLSLLDQADAYAEREGLDFPLEPEARVIPKDPTCVSEPILELDLRKEGVTSIVWATSQRSGTGRHSPDWQAPLSHWFPAVHCTHLPASASQCGVEPLQS